MPVVRLIYVNVSPDQAEKAEQLWKKDCGPLMIREPGCLSEELLKCEDAPGEYISYSEWENDEAIERYRQSDAHREIQRHTRGIHSTERPVVKRYNVVG